MPANIYAMCNNNDDAHSTFEGSTRVNAQSVSVASKPKTNNKIAPLVFRTSNTNPFANLATEACLLDAVRSQECILFLWQNTNTIVIGKNQNAWAECHVEEFEHAGGKIARRITGGGTVYHDIGNLNFSFVARDGVYDVKRQLNVICEAVRSFGVHAQFTGRNDLTVDGCKFSGNAFFTSAGAHLHHGTIMVDVDMDPLMHYLNPDTKKLASKGVSSIKSRVINLADISSEITINALKNALVSAFEKEYGTTINFDTTRINIERLSQKEAFFASDAWRFEAKNKGQKTLNAPCDKPVFSNSTKAKSPFFVENTFIFSDRFDWGNIEFQLHIKEGRIINASVFSDALDADMPEKISQAITGVLYERNALINACQNAWSNNCTNHTSSMSFSLEQKTMYTDCAHLICEQFSTTKETIHD